jgi:hypothetical protein
MISRLERAVTVLWPSFLGACLIEFLVFAFVNPADLHIQVVRSELSVGWIYTLGFFVFWLGCLLSSVLSWTLTDRREPAREA